MAQYMICRTNDKGNLKVIKVISRENYEKLRDTIDKAKKYEQEVLSMPEKTKTEVEAKKRAWEEANRQVSKSYPHLSIPQLTAEYKGTIILNYNSLL